jgi:hypothetical protein
MLGVEQLASHDGAGSVVPVSATAVCSSTLTASSAFMCLVHRFRRHHGLRLRGVAVHEPQSCLPFRSAPTLRFQAPNLLVGSGCH